MKIPFRERGEEFAPKIEMADAIVAVLTAHGTYYDDLSDDQLYGFAEVLWDYHSDLRDEHSRRDMHRKAEALGDVT